MLEKVIVVRHAEPARENADPGLSHVGSSQARALAQKVRKVTGGWAPLVLSSTARRAAETARTIAGSMDVPIKQHPTLLWGSTGDAVQYVASEAHAARARILIVVGHIDHGWRLAAAIRERLCATPAEKDYPLLDHAGGCVLDVKRRTLSAL